MKKRNVVRHTKKLLGKRRKITLFSYISCCFGICIVIAVVIGLKPGILPVQGKAKLPPSSWEVGPCTVGHTTGKCMAYLGSSPVSNAETVCILSLDTSPLSYTKNYCGIYAGYTTACCSLPVTPTPKPLVTACTCVKNSQGKYHLRCGAYGSSRGVICPPPAPVKRSWSSYILHYLWK